MLPLRVTSYIQTWTNLNLQIDKSAGEVDPLIQNLMANQLILGASGLIECAVISVVGEYGRRHGNERIAKFVEKTISLQNSLNCEKIENSLNKFEPLWWPEIKASSRIEDLEALGSGLIAKTSRLPPVHRLT